MATLSPGLMVAGMPSCSDAINPVGCLGINNTAGTPTCAWLMLSGSCARASSTEAMNSPATCCSSQAEGSGCEHQSAELADWMCSVPSGQNDRHRQSGLSLDEMEHNLHLAFALYCPESEVRQWNCGVHCDAVSLSTVQYSTKIGFTDNIEHAAVVAYDSTLGDIILSFKGTDNDAAFIENWMTNLNVLKKHPLSQYPDASVHGGFWDAWLSLKNEVLANIDIVKASHPGVNTIRVIGHSLGGAMASNAAMDLKLNYGFVTSVVNFGSPRPGDFAYHSALLKEVPHWRVTHHNDLVPHTPPKAAGFYHASTEINFPKKTGLEFKICDGSGEDESCANACSHYLTCTSIDDHLHYLDQSIETCGSSSSVVV